MCIYKSIIQVYGLYIKQIYQLSLSAIKDFKQSFGMSCDEI